METDQIEHRKYVRDILIDKKQEDLTKNLDSGGDINSIISEMKEIGIEVYRIRDWYLKIKLEQIRKELFPEYKQYVIKTIEESDFENKDIYLKGLINKEYSEFRQFERAVTAISRFCNVETFGPWERYLRK